MKKTTLYVLLAFSWSASTYAQGSKPILKVAYVQIPQSPKMLALLKTQVADPVQYSKFAAMLSEYKIYYTLSVNTLTSASAFLLDSAHKIPGVQVAGNSIASIKNEKNDFSCKEKFLSSEYAFQGKTSDLEWDITQETDVIAGSKCIKAILKNSPDIVVWFSPDIPVNDGPEFYYGLPGLVLKAETNFDEITAIAITYSSDTGDFKTIVQKATATIGSPKMLSLKEVIASKQNFMQMAENKLKSKQ